MVRMMLAAIAAALVAMPSMADDKKGDKVSSPLQFTLKDIKGESVDLSKYKGKVILLVNVASKCGYTKQYEGLQKLYKQYESQGLVVIGVPANEFGGQEPGTNEDIAKFCSSKYSVTFPMMSKIVVKGEGIDPLYKYLTSKETNPKFAGDITWNFEKFLIDREGHIVNRFAPKIAPESKDLISAVETALKTK